MVYAASQTDGPHGHAPESSAAQESGCGRGRRVDVEVDEVNAPHLNVGRVKPTFPGGHLPATLHLHRRPGGPGATVGHAPVYRVQTERTVHDRKFHGCFALQLRSEVVDGITTLRCFPPKMPMRHVFSRVFTALPRTLVSPEAATQCHYVALYVQVGALDIASERKTAPRGEFPFLRRWHARRAPRNAKDNSQASSNPHRFAIVEDSSA